MCPRDGWSPRDGIVAGSLGREDSLIFPQNGKRGGCPKIPDGKGDKSDSVPLTSKNKWWQPFRGKKI